MFKKRTIFNNYFLIYIFFRFKRHLTRVHDATISEEELNAMFQKNTGKNVNIKQIDDQNLVLSSSEYDNQEEIEVLGK